jgi:hypothetical protein
MPATVEDSKEPGSNDREPEVNRGEIEKLGVFVGTWNTSGILFSEDGADPGELRASDVYEWFPAEKFILHYVDGSMGGAPVKALEILRYDDAEGLVSQSVDNGGQYAENKLRLLDRRWEIVGASLRFEGEFNEDFTCLEGHWFTVQDGQDRAWMDEGQARKGDSLGPFDRGALNSLPATSSHKHVFRLGDIAGW